MPTLDWIGKDKVINHHMEVPYRVLDEQYSYGDDSENMIIHGDNLSALKSLLPQYEGKIKCIYIDPPYNTGNEGWVYNDNVNDPRIKKWLGEVVGTEGVDLSRHDKWLCMMYPRLKLLHRLLAEDGIIFISIDDNEYVNLKIICDEILGIDNNISTLIWDLGTGTTAGHFTRGHEYILCYAKDKSKVENFKNNKENEVIKHGALKKISKKNPAVEITFPIGFQFDGNNAIFKGELGGSEKEYILSEEMKFENGKLVKPVTIKAGFAMRKQVEDYISGKEVFDTKGQKVIRFYFNSKGILFYEKEKTIINPRTVIHNIANTKNGTNELKDIFGNSKFDFPKSTLLLKYLFEIVTDKNSIILDSFAGSGTTAHAVLNMNKTDGGNRKFILIEMCDYAETITAERVKRVIDGYGEDKKKTDGTGGGFKFYELGEKLLDGEYLNEDVPTEKIREYVYFTETKQTLENSPEEPYFMGKYLDTAYYFYYEKNTVTTLDRAFLHTIKTKSESYLIYADKCIVSDEELENYHIKFKKIPRDITKL